MLKAFIIIFTVIVGIIIIAKHIVKNSSDDEAVSIAQVVRLIGRIVAIVVILCFFAFTSFYTVSEDQQAVVTMFGKVVTVETAGVHWRIPLLQDVKKLDMTTHGCSIGYTIEGSTQTYGNNENPQMITSDFNLVDVDFYMEYRITDPVSFLYKSETPEEILTNFAMSSIRATISDYTVDEVMTTAKNEIQQKIRENLGEELSENNIGLQLINLMIQDVEPPTSEVFAAFKSVESAKQGADTDINMAYKYRNETIPNAEAEADEIIQQAEAAKASRIAEAEGQVARFEKMFEEYQNYPLITKRRLFFEKMEELLPDLNIIILTNNGDDTYKILPLGTLTGTN